MAHPQMSHVVDITDTFARKFAALQAHASQTAHMGDQLENFLRGWGAGVAEMFGLDKGRLAECFHIMDLGETGAKVYCSGGATTSTHFIIDVIGYFYAIPEAAPAPPEFTQWEQKARRRVEAEQREG